MDYFTKNKMLFWCVTVLVILNVVTLTSFWLRRPPSVPPRGPEMPRGQRIMENQLQLSAEQAEEFEKLRSEHFARIRPIQSDMHKIRLELVDEIFKSETDDTTVQKLLAELEGKNSQFEKDLFIHFQQLKKACNDEQSAALKSMMIQIIESNRLVDPQDGSPGGRDPGTGPRPGPEPALGSGPRPGGPGNRP